MSVDRIQHATPDVRLVPGAGEQVDFRQGFQNGFARRNVEAGLLCGLAELELIARMQALQQRLQTIPR